MKNKMRISIVIMIAAMLTAGPLMWLTAWSEMHNNSAYMWEKPYGSFEALVMNMKWLGLALIFYGLLGVGLASIRDFYKKKQVQQKDSASVQQSLAAETRDMRQMRTTVRIPMQTNQINTVRKIIEKVLEPEGYEQREKGSGIIWVKEDASGMFSQRFQMTFGEKCLVVQGWTEDIYLGESNLDDARTGQEPQKGMYLLIRKIYAVIQRGKL